MQTCTHINKKIKINLRKKKEKQVRNPSRAHGKECHKLAPRICFSQVSDASVQKVSLRQPSLRQGQTQLPLLSRAIHLVFGVVLDHDAVSPPDIPT